MVSFVFLKLYLVVDKQCRTSYWWHGPKRYEMCKKIMELPAWTVPRSQLTHYFLIVFFSGQMEDLFLDVLVFFLFQIKSRIKHKAHDYSYSGFSSVQQDGIILARFTHLNGFLHISIYSIMVRLFQAYYIYMFIYSWILYNQQALIVRHSKWLVSLVEIGIAENITLQKSRRVCIVRYTHMLCINQHCPDIRQLSGI